jgi:hypothetical protein
VITNATNETIRQFIEKVSDQQHSMAGAVIAASAAQAAALGEACMQISLDNQVDKLDWQDVTARIEQMVHIKNSLIEWCDQDTVAMADYIALQGTGDVSRARHILCDSAAEVSRLSIEAAMLLQAFRPLVFEQVQDDLEMTLNLLTATARSALLLLDSHLLRWSEPSLMDKYNPILPELEMKIDQVTLLKRIKA